METKATYLVTANLSDVVESLTGAIKDQINNAGNVTFLEMPERCDFRALVEEAVTPAKTAQVTKSRRLDAYENLKEIVTEAMGEIGRGKVMGILALFNLPNLAVAEKNRIMIMALTALFQVIRITHDEGSVTTEEAKKAAQKILRAFDLAEGEQ